MNILNYESSLNRQPNTLFTFELRTCAFRKTDKTMSGNEQGGEPCLGAVVIVGNHKNYKGTYSHKREEFKRNKLDGVVPSSSAGVRDDISFGDNSSVSTELLSAPSFGSSSLSSELTRTSGSTYHSSHSSSRSSRPILTRTMEIKRRLRPVMERMKTSLDKIQVLEQSLKKSEHLLQPKTLEEDGSVRTATTTSSSQGSDSSCDSPSRNNTSSSSETEDNDAQKKDQVKVDMSKAIVTATSVSDVFQSQHRQPITFREAEW